MYTYVHITAHKNHCESESLLVLYTSGNVTINEDTDKDGEISILVEDSISGRLEFTVSHEDAVWYTIKVEFTGKMKPKSR